MLYIVLAVLITLQSLMPPNRGELTAAQFYENYNFYLDYLNVGGDRLDENGGWVTLPSSGSVIDFTGGMECRVLPTLTDGVVTAVTVVYQTETDQTIWLWDNTEARLALLAYAGSLPEINCLNFRAKDWLDAPDLLTELDYTLNLRNLVRITQTTQLDGFKDEPYVNLFHPQEGVTATFYQTFTIQRAG